MVRVLGALRACSLAYKRAGGINDQMEVNRPDGSRPAHVRTCSMAPGLRIALNTLET